MSTTDLISAERSTSKVAALFDDEATARTAAADLRQALGLADGQVMVIAPGDPAPGRKLEPEGPGILRTMIRSHLSLGLAGAAVGAVVFGLVHWQQVPFVTSSPVAAALALIGFCAMAGLLLGGLLTLRPDHDPYIQAVRSALTAGRSAVVVHAFSVEQQAQARDWLQSRGGETTTTL